ncbi:MAG TPA: hypothetical protein VF574_14575 [Allosphingosinicella sp.]|jgi:hypothetical protein
MLLAGLGLGAVGVAAGAAPVLRLTASPAGTTTSWWDRTFVSLRSAGMAEWSQVVGSTFSLVSPNGSHLLKVAAVTPFVQSGARPRTLGRSQAFSVAFELVSGPALPKTDRLYEIAHPSYPSLPIYMGVPVGVARTTRLIAVFN